MNEKEAEDGRFKNNNAGKMNKIMRHWNDYYELDTVTSATDLGTLYLEPMT